MIIDGSRREVDLSEVWMCCRKAGPDARRDSLPCLAQTDTSAEAEWQNVEGCSLGCCFTVIQAGNIGHQVSVIFLIKLLLFNIGSLLPNTCF